MIPVTVPSRSEPPRPCPCEGKCLCHEDSAGCATAAGVAVLVLIAFLLMPVGLNLMGMWFDKVDCYFHPNQFGCEAKR